MRKGIGELMGKLLACLLVLATLAAPLGPGLAVAHELQARASCARTTEGSGNGVAHDAGRHAHHAQAADDACGDMDTSAVQCCMGVQCVPSHSGMPPSGISLPNGLLAVTGIPSATGLLDGIDPDPALRPPRSSV